MNHLKPAHQAFTKQSVEFDEIDEKSPIIKWMREQVYKHVFKVFPKNAKVVELNAGTGIDAFTFAQKGYHVLATDASEGMLQQLNHKIKTTEVKGSVRSKYLPFENFNELEEGDFDAVFSDFGGLNCLDDLTKITHHLPNVLKPGAVVTWVLISPYCLWEWLFALKGKFGLAFRRLKKRNVKAHLEGVEFATYFFSPNDVKKAFGQDFKVIELEGLATFTPPPYLDWISIKYPKFYNALTWLDQKTCKWPLLRIIGDHFIISLQYQPQK